MKTIPVTTSSISYHGFLKRRLRVMVKRNTWRQTGERVKESRFATPGYEERKGIRMNLSRTIRSLRLGIAFIGLLALPSWGADESQLRVPAEWEPHVATWMQWPGRWEAAMRPAFARIIDVVQDYEPLHLLANSEPEKLEAQQFLNRRGVPDTNITWHVVPTDNSWMRDNGPVYVTDGATTWIQDWGFDAWGGNFGRAVAFSNDDRIPRWVGERLGMRIEDRASYILERGNLEFNGVGVLALNWDCQDDRNPGLPKTEHERILRDAFGVKTIIWAYGHDPLDGTTGHIDGTARFVSEDTIVIRVSDWGKETEEALAVACHAEGLQVVRYEGDPNWLVGNGFVLAMAENDSQDASRKAQLEGLFPGRDVFLIDAQSIADAGGGIHCVTNDQPL